VWLHALVQLRFLWAVPRDAMLLLTPLHE